MFWIITAIVSLVLYGGTALVVSIGGFSDLLKMFRYLKKLHEKEGKS